MGKLIVIVAIWAFIVSSWITNAVKLVSADFEAPYKTEIIRGIGVPIFPLGAIVGFMDIGEENK